MARDAVERAIIGKPPLPWPGSDGAPKPTDSADQVHRRTARVVNRPNAKQWGGCKRRRRQPPSTVPDLHRTPKGQKRTQQQRAREDASPRHNAREELLFRCCWLLVQLVEQSRPTGELTRLSYAPQCP